MSSPGDPLKCPFQFMGNTVVKEKSYEFRIFFVNHNVKNLLARSVSKNMQLVQTVHAVEEISLLNTDPVNIKLRDYAQPFADNCSKISPFSIGQESPGRN